MHLLEPLEGQEGRTCHVATKALESPAIARRGRRVGVQAHPAVADTARRVPGPGLDAVLLLPVRVRIDPIPEPKRWVNVTEPHAPPRTPWSRFARRR